MKEIFRAKKGEGHTQVQYRLDDEEYGWLLFNLNTLMEEVKKTGAVLTVAATLSVDTDSDAENPSPSIAGLVHKKGMALGHESVEYHFSVRVNMPQD